MITVDRVGPTINVAERLDGLSSNHSAAFKSLVEGNGSGYTYLIPRYFTLKLGFSTSSGTYLSMPSYTSVVGEDWSSQISAINAADALNERIFNIGNGIKRVAFRNLRITGEGASPLLSWSNGNGSAIYVLGNTSTTDIFVEGCLFERLSGHPFYSAGSEQYVRFVHNWVEDCGNGVNVSSYYSDQSHNHIIRSEGFESAKGGIFESNFIVDAFATGISCGGDTSITAYHGGSRIVNNFISNVQGGSGVTTAESMTDIIVGFNYIERSDNAGIYFYAGGTPGSGSYGHMAVGNHLVNCGVTSGSTRMGIKTSIDATRIIANRSYNKANITTHKALYGAFIQDVDAYIDGNYFFGENVGMSVSGATGVATFGSRNTLSSTAGPKISFSSGGTARRAEHLATDSRVVLGGVGVAHDYTDRVVFYNCNGSDRTIAMKSAAELSGATVTFVLTDAGGHTITLDPASTQTINGAATATITGQYSKTTLFSDGANWWVVS